MSRFLMEDNHIRKLNPRSANSVWCAGDHLSASLTRPKTSRF